MDYTEQNGRLGKELVGLQEDLLGWTDSSKDSHLGTGIARLY